DHPWLLARELQTQDVSWISGSAPEPGSYAAKTRYRQADAACTLKDAGAQSFTLSFEQEQWAVTPGQSAVLYSGDVCLGGGIILERPALVAGPCALFSFTSYFSRLLWIRFLLSAWHSWALQ